MNMTVASELARAGQRSSPQNLTAVPVFCERYALKREQAPSPQSARRGVSAKAFVLLGHGAGTLVANT